jgi:hypothetical protein
MDPLVERHYAVRGEKTTANLDGVLGLVDPDQFERVSHRTTAVYGSPCERGLGRVFDNTTYYHFKGNNVFLAHGLVQVGRAITSDNPDGFNMIRYFANSLEEMARLEVESGLRV